MSETLLASRTAGTDAFVPAVSGARQFWRRLRAQAWLSLALIEAAAFARLTRAAMLETLAEDHIRTFRAYGVGERSIVGRQRCAGRSRRSSR